MGRGTGISKETEMVFTKEMPRDSPGRKEGNYEKPPFRIASNPA
jgi:hypothetical protein